ncbi:unnamed protein product [Closterium sp. NIES-54]
MAAKEAEMASYRSTGTYDVPPPGTNVVSGRWLYKVKRLPGSPPVFKARYVARGFSQREGVDFFQTFASTPKMTTLRVLLHIAALRDYELHSLDLSTAFLQRSLHEQIWLRRLPGSFPPGTQWQSRRPVYGLRQAAREWHNTLRLTLAALDFFPSSADPSLFVRRGSTPLFVLVYVDDLVLATPDRCALASVKEELQRRHTCTDLGELQHYLGLQITKDRAARTITLTQSHMVEQILMRFRFPFSKVQLTPLAVDHGLTAPPSDESFESNGPYPELLGCLMYLMTCTRLDLAYPLSVLARFVACGRHRPSHWYTAKRVAKYVASTSGMGLVLGGNQAITLTGYLDSLWADNAETRRSTQGYSFSLGTGAISWRSIRASFIFGSSCEAKVYVAAMAAQELCWLSFLLTNLGERPRSPPVLFANNRSAVLLCEEPRLVGKAKHILLCYFFLRELQQRGQALVRHVVSEANMADIFTKALPTFYGLCQLPHEWHDTLRSTLRDLGFCPSSANPLLFVCTGSTPFFTLVYVDDLVFPTADRAPLTEVKSELQKRHKCTDLSELQCYLGLQITRDRAARTISLTQSDMVQQVLRRFGFQFSTTQPTPLAVDHRLTGPFPDEAFEYNGPYAELVGCLMYLMTCTRPDLAFPLSVLSCFVATGRHRLVHWTAAVRVAKYLATTSGMGLVLGGTQPVVLTGHCDSSYVDDVETPRSTQGYCFTLGASALSWRSTRSSFVASSNA